MSASTSIVQTAYDQVILVALAVTAIRSETNPMPTVLRDGPYSFVFFSSDRGEPVHIHVKRDRHVVKFWLDPIELATNRGFSEPELNDIERLVRQHSETLRQAWHEHFDS